MPTPNKIHFYTMAVQILKSLILMFLQILTYDGGIVKEIILILTTVYDTD